MLDPLRPHTPAVPARHLPHHPLHIFSLRVTLPEITRGSSCKKYVSPGISRVDEGVVELGARVGALEPARRVVIEPVERAAEGAGPAPALQVAVAVEVGPEALAARDAVAEAAGGRAVAALVGGGEGRHGDAPLEGACL
jgi:hypothetical protein